VRLTDSLEFHDVTLLESLSNYIHYNTTMKSPHETHGITSISYHKHDLTSNHMLSQMSQSHANPPSTNQVKLNLIPKTWISVSLYHIQHTEHHTSYSKR